MNARLGFVGGVLAALLVVLVGAWRAQQETPPAGQPGADEMKAMMERMQAIMAPGESHRFLQDFVGEWKVTARMFMGGPGSPAMESHGSAKVEWILDGRYISEQIEYEMEMPGPDGKPRKERFQGRGLTGYDNFQNMYVSNWVDNMGTQMLNLRGARHPQTGEFTYYAQMDEPTLDVYGRTIKLTCKVESKDKHVVSVIDLHAGDDYKVVEIVYERK